MYDPTGLHKESMASIAVSVSSSGSSGSAGSGPVRIVDTVMALYSYTSDKPHSLAFKRGDTIYVLTKLGSGWWEGVLANGQQGWFPSNYTQSLPVAATATQQVQQQQQYLNSSSQSVSTASLDSILTTNSGSDVNTEHPTTTTPPSSMSVQNGPNTPLFLQTGGAMGFDVEDDSSSPSVVASSSRKGSVVSYGSSVNDVECHMAPHTEFLDGYRLVDTQDPMYKHLPNYWIPQISNTGKLLYVNTTRKHITTDLPFEKIDSTFSEQREEIPTYIPTPAEIVENTQMAIVDDKKILVDPLKAFAIKTKAGSFDSGSMIKGQFQESGFGTGSDDEAAECSKWSYVLKVIKHNVASAMKSFISKDSSFEEKFEIVSLSIYRLSSYAGIPPETYPSLNDHPELGLVYRKLVNTLAKMGLYKDIMFKLRDQGTKEHTEGYSDLSNDLVSLSAQFISLFQSFAQSELELLSDTKYDEDEILRRPSTYQVRHFVDGTWIAVTVNASGHIVTPEIEVPTYNIGNTMRPKSVRDHEMPLLSLESYSTTLEINSDILENLESRNKNLNNIFTQVFGTGSPVLPRTVDGTRDRRKLLSSSLHTFCNVVRLILNILESIDLSVFYEFGSEPSSPRARQNLLTLLFNYLGTKQSLCESLVDMDSTLKQNDSTDSDFIAALTAKFEQAKIEDIYFTFEQSNEKQIRDKVENLQNQIDMAIGLVHVLAKNERRQGSSYSSLTSVYPHIEVSRHSYETRESASIRSFSTAGSDRRKASTVGSIPETTISSQSQKDAFWFLGLEYGKELVYDKKGSPRGGTIRALVEQLTLHDRLISEFNTALLLTFRSFTDASVLLELLIERFLIQPPEGLTQDEFKIWCDKKQRPIRLRVVNVIKTWLDTYWFEDDCDELTPQARIKLFESLGKFCTMLQSQKFPGANLLTALVEKRKANKEPSFKRTVITSSKPSPHPLLPKNLKKIKLSDIEPEELARQLCIREFKLFVVISSHECLRRACSGRNKSGHSGQQRIGDFIKNSNSLTNWVSYSILRHAEARRRAGLIRYFIHVSEYCLKFNNFSSMTAIISALFSSTIHRMKKTWDYVTPKMVEKLDRMNRLMNSSRNFNEYRDMLSIVEPPAVPFFGVYLTDLTFVEDGNPDYLQAEQGIINFAKRMKAADIIENIRQFQSKPYNFQMVPEIQKYLDGGFQTAPPIEEHYDTSLNFEPREKPGSDKVARALEENGIL